MLLQSLDLHRYVHNAIKTTEPILSEQLFLSKLPLFCRIVAILRVDVWIKSQIPALRLNQARFWEFSDIHDDAAMLGNKPTAQTKSTKRQICGWSSRKVSLFFFFNVFISQIHHRGGKRACQESHLVNSYYILYGFSRLDTQILLQTWIYVNKINVSKYLLGPLIYIKQ